MITDIQYAAIEPTYKRLRLAYDHHGNVYIMDNNPIPHSATFSMATLGELYNEYMEVYELDKVEMTWVASMAPFVEQLSFQEGNT